MSCPFPACRPYKRTIHPIIINIPSVKANGLFIIRLVLSFSSTSELLAVKKVTAPNKDKAPTPPIITRPIG